MRLSAIPVLLSALMLLLASAQQQTGSQRSGTRTLEPSRRAISADLFALNIVNFDDRTAWPSVKFSAWRNFHASWFRVEPHKGEWNFVEVDREVSAANAHNVDMMLVLHRPPAWATPSASVEDRDQHRAVPNLADWRDYVRTVSTRYKGRVRLYELWNEPEVTKFYSGTVPQLVELNRVAYEVIKQVDPNAVVVSSSMSRDSIRNGATAFEQFIRAGGANYADVVGFHFYPNLSNGTIGAPEETLDTVAAVRRILTKYSVTKPLWNTETGWQVENDDKNEPTESWAGDPLPIDRAGAYCARLYILSAAADVERLFWYAWGHRSMGLTEWDGKTAKRNARAYDEVERWLVGSQLLKCDESSNRVWTCDLKRGSSVSHIVWRPGRTLVFDVPKSWGATQVRALSGEVTKPTSTVNIGESPILIESQAQSK